MKNVLGRKQRFLLVWVARLAILTYVFQISAADHWHRDPSNIEGVPGKSSHVYHCHGSVSECADQGGSATTSISYSDLTPIPPRPLMSAVVTSDSSPARLVLTSADEPPRAA